MSTLFLLVIFGFVAWAMARTVQKQASGSPAMKRRMLIGGCLFLVFGLVIALWLPGRVPETQGSPATIVALLLLWGLGGGLAFVGVSVLVGALFARPSADDPAKSPSR